MKSSLGRLRKFALHKSDGKEKREYQASAHLDELAQAARDMHDMRNCYDSLLSAAAATANSAYEFSESLREMGACLHEKTALNDDEETGRVLLKLGQVQFELQKLVDSYRSHIFMTITTPSESLLNELRTVEEMKRQCDEKRIVYEHMTAQQRDKGKLKSGKGESVTLQQLQAAHEEYDDEATLFVFRLKSLKQGQSRSLLTQAARHHAAQLNFFRKGLQSLEAAEPLVRIVTEQQHIEYQFSGLEDDDGEGGEYDDENDYDTNEDGELSFDYRQNKQGFDVVSTSRNSMELEQSDVSFRQASTVEDAEVHLDKTHGDYYAFGRDYKTGSHSAPIFAEKIDTTERTRQMQPSPARKFHTYVLPTPADAKSSIPARSSYSAPRTRPTGYGGHTHNLWHSTPLELKRHEKDSGDDDLSGHIFLKGQSVLKESNSNNSPFQLPPPLTEGHPLQQLDGQNASGSKKIKRQAFSGPLSSKPSLTKPVLSASGPIASSELPQLVSGLLSRVPVHPSSSPRVSPSASPPLVSSPKISELHELPRPPGISATKAARSPSLVGHSAPLAYRSPELSMTNKVSPVVSNAASPLPTPPLAVPRSFSIPSRSQRAAAFQVAQIPRKSEEAASPPLTPLSLTNMKPESTVFELASQSGQRRGGS
ncbi:uncharacterized protein At2g33490 [Malania oleifera]|uniref:uncharacterized protein At2g33490 n=1 Tax=Malania oleifera TaxID=397392 RepID=UPI0025ADFE99|nr:uncharacterized protein At2g33490 [Malania oleifera]